VATRNGGQNYTLRKKLQIDGKNYIIRSFIIHLSHTIIKRTKSRNMRLPGHVASIGDIKYVHKSLVGIPEGKNNLVKLNMDEMTTIKRILNWLSG
jgi:hypothetical protein